MTSISLPGASGSYFVRSVFTCWACAWAIPKSSLANADNRLSLDPLGRVEGGDGIVEGSHVTDVDELLRAEVESRLTDASAPGADDVRAGLTCELGRHRTDYAGRTVHEDALPRTKAAVLEQPLPRGQARHHEGRAHCEVNVAR